MGGDAENGANIHEVCDSFSQLIVRCLTDLVSTIFWQVEILSIDEGGIKARRDAWTDESTQGKPPLNTASFSL